MSGPKESRTRRGGVSWTDRPTGKDVAKLAGVSTQTVSRVANGAENVHPDTRARVLEAMAQVGYAPNAAARALRGGGSTMLGVVAHHLSRTGEANVLEGLISTAHRHGYSVSLTVANSGSASDINEAITRVQQGVAGIVVVGLDDTDVAELERPARLPFVLADSRELPLPTAGHEQFNAGREATQHLLDLGHHTVHHLAGPVDSPPARLRQEGWRAALEEAGRPVPEVRLGDWSPESGYEQGVALAADPAVTAVFAGNDEMAAGLYRALAQHGRSVPNDVSVVGFDDQLGRYLQPALTSVHQDFAVLGELLVNRVVALIKANEPGADPAARALLAHSELIPSQLVVRESTAPARVS